MIEPILPPHDVGKNRAALLTFVSVLLLALYFGYYLAAPYVLALLMGGILAMLSFPLHKKLINRKVPMAASALIVTAGVIFLVVGPILLFATLAIKQGVTLAQYLTDNHLLSIEGLSTRLYRFDSVRRLLEAVEFESQIRQVSRTLGKTISTIVLSMAKNIPEGALQLVLACMACYFMLIDGPRFLRWISARLPLASDVRHKLSEVFQETAISVIWASMAAAGTQAVIMFFAFLILDVPAAFLAGGLTFVFAFIPFAGSVPVWLTGAGYLYAQGQTWQVITMIGFGIFTSSIDNVVRPYVLKGRNEMHPLVALVAIFGGIQMFGLFGVFLGPIIAAVVITLLQIWPVIGRRYGLEFDRGIQMPEDLES